jgi:CheY-like chemotaxis protein
MPLCVQEATHAFRLASCADVIVTEILLPGALDGYALIEAVRHDQTTRDIPVVVVTVCAWAEEEARARRVGCDVFLSKPCTSCYGTFAGRSPRIHRGEPARIPTCSCESAV